MRPVLAAPAAPSAQGSDPPGLWLGAATRRGVGSGQRNLPAQLGPAVAGRVQRQRMVYGVLAEELAGQVHALSVKALAPGET